MGWVDDFEALLEAKSDAELGAFVASPPPEPCNMLQIDMELALQKVLEGVGNWELRMALTDDTGIHPDKEQACTIRKLVTGKREERQNVLNPVEEG